MPVEPAAFMSYVRFNDEHDDGQLTAFRERLSNEVRVQTGAEFAIFQDRNDIVWGQNWQQRIDQTLDSVTLLLVIVTPGLFRSPPCRAEFARFLDQERALGRADLILPVYYVSAREMDDPALRAADKMASALATRQFADWRDLRFEPFTSPVARKAIAQLASRMRDTFWQPPPASARPAGDQQMTAGSPAETAAPVASKGGPARTEPPTHIVDPYERGDFATIGAAIAAAAPGDRILVRPGLYEEGLVIDKPLEILGDGRVADIEVRSRDAATVTFKASIGRVANLTLRQASGTGTWYGVDIVQGRLDLEGCDISSQTSACVGIHGGADPRLRRNQIHDGQTCGVMVYDSGMGTLEDNEITRNASAGVQIGTGGNPTLRRNQIHDGQTCGVLVFDGGLGTLEDNDISGNALTGVQIGTGGNPILRRNQIHDGRACGVLVCDGGLGTLEDNDISGNALTGVQIRTGGNPTLRRNQIHDGKQGGVLVCDDGLGTLEDNRITSNTSAGLQIRTGGDPSLRRNQILDGKTCGVLVYDNGLGTLERNDISGNAFTGVEIRTGGNPTMRANRINHNQYNAIFVHDGGRGVIEDNDLTGNARDAWHIGAECEGNVIRARNQE